MVACLASAGRSVSYCSASAVRTARRRNAWPFSHNGLDRSTLDWNRSASRRRVARIARHARADRIVVDNAAFGVEAANARARVDASIVGAAFVARAIRVGWASTNNDNYDKSNLKLIYL